MKTINNKKLLIMIIMVLFFSTIFQLDVYAESTNFILDKESIEISLNGTKYISYSGGSGTVLWSSNDPTIATVDASTGRIEGVKIGTTTITATRGEETATCQVNVVYDSITIVGSTYESVSSVNLVLNEHNRETLYAKVEDDDYNEVDDAGVTWISSDSSIVSVGENTGIIEAVSTGTATITASAAGVTDTCEVNVLSAPVFTDFSHATYETELNYNTETLKISGITPNEEDIYYYIVTSTNSKPDLALKYGGLDYANMGEEWKALITNTDENYMYSRNLARYTELNQDLYLWVVQTVKLEDSYCDDEGNNVLYSTKFAVEGKKLTRSKLPSLNLILQSFSIGHWSSSISDETDNYTYINFNFPSDTENRKFTLKIGKVTDVSILKKIQNNDYSGITELLSYAKNNSSIYSEKLTTTDIGYYRNDVPLFNGKQLLENKAYYYIYVQFDDENGKYIPVEGVTLGQAWFSSTSDSWDLWAYTSSDFKWDNLTPSVQEPEKEDKEEIKEEVKEEIKEVDTTTSTEKLPNTGKTIITAIAISSIIVVGIVSYKKYRNLKGI